MSKERLEEIVEKYSKAEIIEHINGIDIIAVDKADIEWFTERVNELEEQVNEKHIAFMVTVEEMVKFAKRNDRYREKFEAIQDIQQWHRKEPDYEVLNIVNEALEGEE